MTTSTPRDADGEPLCAWCGGSIPQKGVGRRRDYCRRSCRQRAYEQRQVDRTVTLNTNLIRHQLRKEFEAADAPTVSSRVGTPHPTISSRDETRKLGDSSRDETMSAGQSPIPAQPAVSPPRAPRPSPVPGFRPGIGIGAFVPLDLEEEDASGE
ncbi:hypothetical protein [Streptomyces sp. NPDC093223]|uniref:hypothetical protein n=1 Tax=Streptomyces sp. NPDC093223 TaxID=3366033 RepID=UPI00382FCEE5